MNTFTPFSITCTLRLLCGLMLIASIYTATSENQEPLCKTIRQRRKFEHENCKPIYRKIAMCSGTCGSIAEAGAVLPPDAPLIKQTCGCCHARRWRRASKILSFSCPGNITKSVTVWYPRIQECACIACSGDL